MYDIVNKGQPLVIKADTYNKVLQFAQNRPVQPSANISKFGANGDWIDEYPRWVLQIETTDNEITFKFAEPYKFENKTTLHNAIPNGSNGLLNSTDINWDYVDGDDERYYIEYTVTDKFSPHVIGVCHTIEHCEEYKDLWQTEFFYGAYYFDNTLFRGISQSLINFTPLYLIQLMPKLDGEDNYNFAICKLFNTNLNVVNCDLLYNQPHKPSITEA